MKSRPTTSVTLVALVACGSAGHPGASAADASAKGTDAPSSSPPDASATDAGQPRDAAPMDASPDATGADDDAPGPESSTMTPGAGPGFPRIGAMNISVLSGAAHGGYDDGYVQWASKMLVDIIGANWVGAGAALVGGSREAFVQAIHAQSTIGSRVFQYYVADSNNEDWPLTSVSNWILYQHGTSGPCAANFFSTNFCNTNPTLYTPPDANGLHLEGEFAQAVIATLVTGSSVDAAPSIDGTYHDNTFLSPAVAGDYSRDGTQEPVGDPTAGAWMRAGLAEGYAYLEAHSSLIAIGNLGGWGVASGPGGGTDASGLSSLVQGGIIEGVFGDSWSVETWSGFAMAKTHYQFCMANTIAPRLVLVHHSKLQANGSDPSGFASDGTPTGYGPAYRPMRYSLAFTLMDDGYYATTQDSSYYATERNWFDEYAVDPQTGVALAFPAVDAGIGYLGQPTDAAWPAALPSGVYERHFANAATGKTWLVLLNPKGNGAQTVQLGGSAKKLTGTQDPTVNDGSIVTSVTLQDRDGLIVQLQ